MSLDTLANVKVRLGITSSADDTLLTALQATADAWIAEHCQRDFEGGTFTEYHPGGAIVFLRNFPVTSVTSVKADSGYGFGSSTVVPTTAYIVHLERGVIVSLSGSFAPMFAAQTEAVMTRQMRFASLAAIDTTSLTVGFAVAVALAWWGSGYWALVVQEVVYSLVSAVLVWSVCGWRPGAPVRGSGVRSMIG